MQLHKYVSMSVDYENNFFSFKYPLKNIQMQLILNLTPK